MKSKIKLTIVIALVAFLFAFLGINFANASRRYYTFFFLSTLDNEGECTGDFCSLGNVPTPNDDNLNSGPQDNENDVINVENILGIEWNTNDVADSHTITFSFTGADLASVNTNIILDDPTSILPAYSSDGSGNTIDRSITFNNAPNGLGNIEITIQAIDTEDGLTVLGQETITLTVINYMDEYACTSSDPLANIYYDGTTYNLGIMRSDDTPSPEVGKAQLLCMSENQATVGATGNVLTSDFKLTTDVSFSNGDYADSSKGWVPLGDYTTNPSLLFSGNFDGEGHTVSNLYINRNGASEQGFFGRAHSTISTISNIGMVNGKVTAQNDCGCLVGYNKYVNIVDSYAKCSISGKNNLGELVGTNEDGTISRSFSSGYVLSTEEIDVEGDNNVGGLVGVNNAGIVSNSYSRSDVTGKKNNIGGLVGYNEGGTISRSYASGSIDSNANTVGGLVGANTGVIEYSYAISSEFTALGDNDVFDLDNYCSETKDFDCDGTNINVNWSDVIWTDLGLDDTPNLQ